MENIDHLNIRARIRVRVHLWLDLWLFRLTVPTERPSYKVGEMRESNKKITE